MSKPCWGRAAFIPYILQAGDGWHAGVIGIVAGRLKDKYHRPTFIIAFDEDGLSKVRRVPSVLLMSVVWLPERLTKS